MDGSAHRHFLKVRPGAQGRRRSFLGPLRRPATAQILYAFIDRQSSQERSPRLTLRSSVRPASFSGPLQSQDTADPAFRGGSQAVRQQGYRQVQPLKCEGSTYRYHTLRGEGTFMVRANSYSAEIVSGRRMRYY